MKESNRPYIILSSAMTLDGKIASKIGDSEISDDQDWKEVHKLRTEVDGIIVGKNTIIKDNPKLHIKFYEHNGYYRIIFDSDLSIPLESKVITFQPDIYPTIICTTDDASSERIRDFEARGVRIIKSGIDKKVDILNLMPKLYNMGIQRILLEGGGTLNWSFIKNNLIDEIRLLIAPWMIGGKDAISLVDGDGFETMAQAPRYKLHEILNRDNYLVLKYKKIK
ncbi:MAG: 2,5-diamino-6-(ribosylamino)-4(3H)-pyrimidinone 5'-phosphate reductase [Candidatus Lokiarchaeia archaeon]|nr:2,5-diamino-6-(ribosylamino)-4(3H)-pyrimidinone 5'-phosphate reductase [Candidatus Lokiarchaeia archaeon]